MIYWFSSKNLLRRNQLTDSYLVLCNFHTSIILHRFLYSLHFRDGNPVKVDNVHLQTCFLLISLRCVVPAKSGMIYWHVEEYNIGCILRNLCELFRSLCESLWSICLLCICLKSQNPHKSFYFIGTRSLLLLFFSFLLISDIIHTPKLINSFAMTIPFLDVQYGDTNRRGKQFAQTHFLNTSLAETETIRLINAT